MTLKQLLNDINDAVYQHPIMLDKEITDIEVMKYDGTDTVEQVKFKISVCDGIENTFIVGWKPNLYR